MCISDLKVSCGDFSCAAEVNLDGPFESSSPWEFELKGEFDVPDEDCVEFDNLEVKLVYSYHEFDMSRFEGEVLTQVESKLSDKVYEKWCEIQEDMADESCPILDDGW